MQVVSAAWITNVGSAVRRLNYGLQISFSRSVATTSFFTIGTSTIGGSDILKSGGDYVTFYDKFAYTTYSRYATSWNVERKLGQYPWGVITAQADVELDNSSQIFTPGYDATIGSQIYPNRPVRISVGIGNDSLQQFIGFSGTMESSVRERTSSFHANDAMQYINEYVSSLGVFVGKSVDTIIIAALQEMGFSANQYQVDPSLQPPLVVCVPYGRKWGDVFQDFCEAEQALLFADENGIIRFWNRHHFISNTAIQQTYSFSNMLDIKNATTPIFNDVLVRVRPRSIAQVQQVWSLQQPVTIAPGGIYLVEADFTDDDGPLPVTTVDTPTYTGLTSSFSASSTDTSTGILTDRSSNVMVQAIVNRGTSYSFQLKNNNGVAVSVDSVVLYGTPAKVTQVVEYRKQDATSIDLYGRNPGNGGQTLVIENDALQDLSSGASLAFVLVQDFKDARRRYEVPVFANPALQIGDFVSVTNRYTSETKNMYIVGITTHLGRSAALSQVLELEERLVHSYFKVGTSTIGGTDTLAP